MYFIPKVGGRISSSKSEHEFFYICYHAKQTHNIFSWSDNKAYDYFSLIYCDLWGPYKKCVSCGAIYFMIIMDDFSRVF